MSNTSQLLLMGSLIGALVGTAVGLLALSLLSEGQPITQLHAPTSLHPVRPHTVSAAIATRAQRVAVGPIQAVQVEPVADVVAEGTPAAVPVAPAATSAQATVCGTVLLSIIGAITGLFFAKRTVEPSYISMDVEEGLTRRHVLAAGVAAAGLGAAMHPQAATAAYGDSANVFGKSPESNQVFKVSGDGWSGIMPGKYNRSKEQEFPGTVGRWEDNFDSISNSSVVALPVSGSSVSNLGSLDEVRTKYVQPLLGQQSFQGDTISEGGFARGQVASSALLDQQTVEKDGKTYYIYELLSRTADGDEGGKHQLFSLAVGNGKLFILKHQAGDKRWFKGLEKPLRDSIAAFTVQ